MTWGKLDTRYLVWSQFSAASICHSASFTSTGFPLKAAASSVEIIAPAIALRAMVRS
jgi:hypothetical protein